jgi:hypothetical protein
MPFFPVDDGLWGHPKADAVGDAALGLWVRVGSYCAKYTTEGIITARDLRKLAARPARVRALVDAGLWHAPGHECGRCPQPPADGYVFHEWHKNGNRTREQVEADRAAAAERQRRARARKGEQDPDPEGTSRRVSRRDRDTSSRRDTPVDNDGSDAKLAHFSSEYGRKTSELNSVPTSGLGDVAAGQGDSSRRESHDPGQARPGQEQTPLLTLVGRLAVSDARGTAPPPAEQIALWQDIAGPGVDLEAEARAYLERNLGRPARNEAAAWVGWLRKGAERRANGARCYCATYGANGHPAHDSSGRSTTCTDPNCVGGWLPDDARIGSPRPCLTCRPHLQPVPTPRPEAS